MRRLRLAMILAIGTTLLAVPAASADEFLFVIPAGEGCAFDVGVEEGPIPEMGSHHNPVGSANIIFTNVDTGATYVQMSRHIETAETFDPDTNTVQFVDQGRRFIPFLPGDPGPDGVVGEPGALLAFSGTVRLTVDLDTELLVAFSYDGTYIDLCAELAS